MDNNNMYQNGFQQQPYQQNFNANNFTPQLETPNSVGDWVVTILLTCIPCVNIIMLCIWAFGSGTQKSKSNWAKAQLIFVAIGVGLTILIYAVMGAALVGALGSIY